MNELIVGNSYLIKSYGIVKRIKLLRETDTCYKFEFENKATEWKHKIEFQTTYTVIENLGNEDRDSGNQGN